METRPADPASLDSTIAELRSVADWLERQRSRIAGMSEKFVGTDREDVLIALHEAERQLDLANRAVDRAARSASGR